MLLGRRALSVMAQQQPQLDRSAFKQVIRVPAVRVPKQKCQELMKKLRGYVWGQGTQALTNFNLTAAHVYRKHI